MPSESNDVFTTLAGQVRLDAYFVIQSMLFWDFPSR